MRLLVVKIVVGVVLIVGVSQDNRVRMKVFMVVSVNQKSIESRGPKNKCWPQEQQKRDGHSSAEFHENLYLFTRSSHTLPGSLP